MMNDNSRDKDPKTGRTLESVEKEKRAEEKHHEKAVEDTFPASDPPATSQPGSGVTGPEVAREKSGRH